MDFGRKVERTIIHAFEIIGEKADQMSGIAALKYSRYQLEKQRNTLLRELGSYVYKAHLVNSSHSDKVGNFIEELKELDAEIRRLNIKIEQR